MHWQYRCDRLHFHDDEVFYDQVDTIADIEFHAFVGDRYRNLSDETDLSLRELTLQTLHICGLEETGTDSAVYLDGCTDDSACRPVVR